jgi:SAM-dependent methyltransferase
MTKYTDFVNYNLSMLTDSVRIQAYRQALGRTVRPGDVVADVGSGSGILAFLACRAGAGRVYAIEAEDVIEMARQVCAKNGLEDRVVFIHDQSFRAELPEQVDVIVTETMGTFGVDEGLVGSVLDIRDRFLKPSGAVIPRALALSVVPIELPGFYQHMVEFWSTNCQGVDFSPVRHLAANNFHPIKIHADVFLSAPAQVLQVALHEAKSSDLAFECSFYATRRGRLHGLAGWFAAELSDGTSLTNEPERASHWGVAFFPLDQPVPVERGNRIAVRVLATGNGSLWRWQVAVNGRRFDQETPWGFEQLPGEAHKLSAGRMPKLSRKGEAERFLLSLLDGTKSLCEIEAEFLGRYPDVGASKEQASAFVRDIVLRNT